MLYILLHLPSHDADQNAQLVKVALQPAHSFIKFTLIRLPTASVPGALHDTQSTEVLCAKTAIPLDPAVLRVMRWAVHKRFADTKIIHARLRCELIGGDESRLKGKTNSYRRQKRMMG